MKTFMVIGLIFLLSNQDNNIRNEVDTNQFAPSVQEGGFILDFDKRRRASNDPMVEEQTDGYTDGYSDNAAKRWMIAATILVLAITCAAVGIYWTNEPIRRE